MNHVSAPLAYLVSRYPAISHTFILREISQLRALGHQIHTASINQPDRAREKMDSLERSETEATYYVKTDGMLGAVKALAVSLTRSPIRAVSMISFAVKAFGGLKGVAYAVEAMMVARWMRSRELRHLHVHFGNAGAAVGVLTKMLTNCHLSYTIHGPDEFDDVRGQMLPLKMRAADAVVCISQFARSQLMRISAPSDWSKFQVCRLGVDPAQFSYARSAISAGSDASALRLLCVGRLTPAKGQVLLIQACARLRDAGQKFTLSIIGDGPDRSRVEACIEKLQLGNQISLRGALSQAEVREALRNADVFVLPSFAEGIPVVLMEAMAAGVPCVSSPVNGIPELISHGRTGLLSTPGDVDSLAAQLLRLCEDPGYREQLAFAGRQKIESSFDLARNVGHLSQIFHQFPFPLALRSTALNA